MCASSEGGSRFSIAICSCYLKQTTKLFYEFKKNLTTPEDSIREKEEVQEDKEEVVTSQQEKLKTADELQRNMDNCK